MLSSNSCTSRYIPREILAGVSYNTNNRFIVLRLHWFNLCSKHNINQDYNKNHN